MNWRCCLWMLQAWSVSGDLVLLVEGSVHLFDGLDLNQQAHVVGHDVRPPSHAPARALDRGLEVASADLTLEHRVRVAVETMALQRHGERHPQQRPIASAF